MSQTVLDIGNFVVAAGEIVALLGPNGAGKTALIETILGFRPSSQAIRLLGHDVRSLPVERRIALGVGYVPERRQRVEEMLSLFPVLAQRPDARAWLLSGGQQQMLALARALMDRPCLLLLDEPTLGLAPLVVADLLARLTALAADGTAILLSEQRAGLALGIAGRGVILSRGRIVRLGSAKELLADPRLADLMAGA